MLNQRDDLPSLIAKLSRERPSPRVEMSVGPVFVFDGGDNLTFHPPEPCQPITRNHLRPPSTA